MLKYLKGITMKIKDLNAEYDRLQLIYGSKRLNSIYGGGCENNPQYCFIFMNPTKKNIASLKEWQGRRVPFIGMKSIWPLFYKISLLDKDIMTNIIDNHPSFWDEDLAEAIYNNVEKHKCFLTNLAKCTQTDAKKIPDYIYKKYLKLLYQEIDIIKPKVIITFGSQVSTVFLGKKIEIANSRKKYYPKVINGVSYKVYPVYYPIGNGIRNINKAISDLKHILAENK